MTLDSIYNPDQCYVLGYVFEKTSGKILQSVMEKVK
jgi:hypothetical protein